MTFVLLVRLALAHRKDPSASSSYRELGIANTTHAPRRLREGLASVERGEIVEVVYGQAVRLYGNVRVDLDDAELAQHPEPNVRKLFPQPR